MLGGVGQKGLELLVGPGGLLIGLALVLVAFDAAVRGQLFPDVLPGRGFVERGDGGEDVDDGAVAHVAAEFGFHQDDGGDHLGIHAELFFGFLQRRLLLLHVGPSLYDPGLLGHFVVIQGRFVVQKVERNAFGFEEDLIIFIKGLDAPGIEPVHHQALLQGIEKGFEVFLGGGRALRRGDDDDKCYDNGPQRPFSVCLHASPLHGCPPVILPERFRRMERPPIVIGAIGLRLKSI